MDPVLASKFLLIYKEKDLENKEDNKSVKMSKEILNYLYSTHYFQKEKALFLITTPKELGIIKRENHLNIWLKC